ncbi:MAG: hypothetical protein KKF65_02755 [Nanoarchaeota archaeon]|nr:hypothetical protein [Nanoarchaeota archaeon]
MVKLVYFLIMLSLIVFLSGCTQTVVKYQCVDGSFVDSADSCSAVECQTNCPELDCASCPSKIEYQEKIVEKSVEVIKYQCYDDTFETSKYKCKSPEEVKLDSLEEGKHGEITIQRVQVQLANLYPTRVTVENTGKESITPKFDVVVKKGSSTVCEGSPMIDEFTSIQAGESITGEFTVMGCMFESDGQYTLTVDLLDSDYNKLGSDSEDFTVDYWSKFI